jgi:hypothetical protein
MKRPESEKKNWDEGEWRDDFDSSSSFPSASQESFNENDSNWNPNSQNNSTSEEFVSGGEEDSVYQQENYDTIDENMKKKRPPLPKNSQSKSVEIDLAALGTPAVVGIIFIRSAFQGAIVGGVFGGLQGAFYGFQNRAALGGNVGTYVMQMSVASGKSFGLWLGTYQASTVFLGRIRHKNDVVNPMIGGFLAGSLSSLASRNRTQILYNGVASGVLMGFMHSFSKF